MPPSTRESPAMYKQAVTGGTSEGKGDPLAFHAMWPGPIRSGQPALPPHGLGFRVSLQVSGEPPEKDLQLLGLRSRKSKSHRKALLRISAESLELRREAMRAWNGGCRV